MSEEIKKQIRDYIKESLSIRMGEEGFGFNGREMVVEILFENEVIDRGSIVIKQDEG